MPAKQTLPLIAKGYKLYISTFWTGKLFKPSAFWTGKFCKPCSKPSNSWTGKKAQQQSGFTLIELIVGIVVFSVALVMLTSVIMPQTRKGIDPIWQVRALTLGQSVLAEISSKAFDENSITNSGRQACTTCSSSSNLGADAGETRANYDDIDDYNGLSLSGVDIANTSQASLSTDTADLFLGFEAQIRVFYDANYDGINDDDINQDGTLDTGTVTANQKLLEVTIITPDGERIPFSTYRNNF